MCYHLGTVVVDVTVARLPQPRPAQDHPAGVVSMDVSDHHRLEYVGDVLPHFQANHPVAARFGDLPCHVGEAEERLGELL